MIDDRKVGTAKLEYNGKTYEYPVYEGTEAERAWDIRKLRADTGMITYDPGYVNTGTCESTITFLDGDKGILRYRGYDIAELAEKCEFIEVAYLLIHGKLPNQAERQQYAKLLNMNSMLPEDMVSFFRNYPERAHPMAVASAMVVSLSSFYPEMDDKEEERAMAATRLLSKLRTMAAYSYKKSVNEPFVYRACSPAEPPGSSADGTKHLFRGCDARSDFLLSHNSSPVVISTRPKRSSVRRAQSPGASGRDRSKPKPASVKTMLIWLRFMTST